MIKHKNTLFARIQNEQKENGTKESRYIVQYKGGGYDGCFWEWNYSLISNPKIYGCEFLDIASSGRMGAKSLDSLITRYNEDAGFYFYDITSEEDINEFLNECNSSHIKNVFQFLNDDLGIKLFAPCPICKNKTSSKNMILGEFSGNGGISVISHSWHCKKCDSANHCESCNKFNLTTQLREDGQYYCDTCHEQIKEDNEEEILENKKSEIENKAWQKGIPLSQWYDYFGGVAVQNINTGVIYATIGAN